MKRKNCNCFYEYLFHSITLCVIIITGSSSVIAQTTIEPTSITLGVDKINMVDRDTILHWGKNRGAFRGGYFLSNDVANANVGEFSFAYGFSNIAKGGNSIAMGIGNNSDRVETVTIGKENNALFDNAIGIGRKNIVTSRDGIALGNFLLVNNTNAIALGAFNIDMPVPPNQDDIPIFSLGNGDGRDKGRSNAITVLFDGRMSLRTPTPESDLHLVHQNGDHKAGFRIENEANGNWWRFYSRSASNELELYNLTSSPSQLAVGKFEASGNYVNLSDRRLKENIIELPYGLDEVLELSPKRYQFINVPERDEIGLIAQEVVKIVPELVNFDEEQDKYMMNYNGFGVLSIKAIQELNEVVEVQSTTIKDQQDLINDLIKRVQQLEKSQ